MFGFGCNIHISLKNNSDFVLMMTVMMRPSRLNVERGASQIRLTGLAYKKRTSDFNGWQMRVFPPNTTIPRWSYRAHLCNHQNKLCPGPQTGAGESRDYPSAQEKWRKVRYFFARADLVHKSTQWITTPLPSLANGADPRHGHHKGNHTNAKCTKNTTALPHVHNHNHTTNLI